MYAQIEDAGPSSPLIREWTPERAELVGIRDALNSLTAVVVSALGGSDPPPKPAPRPETAMDRLAAKVEDASYEYLLERIEEARQVGAD